MKIYNKLSDTLEDIGTTEDNKIRMYVCGITVYDDCHIGHARTIVVFDILRRYLIHKGKELVYVQNFTDVDDKIINRAKLDGKSPDEISSKYIESYFEDFSKLNVLKADFYPKATDHIIEIINAIKILKEKNYTYTTLNGVYFKVRAFPNYGNLSKKQIDELEEGTRIEIDKLKEDPLDFALWKFSSDVPNWESPWGRGRPGWHIECSVMVSKFLGNEIEIHGGGTDLIFPHHENEIAQSETFNEKKLAKLWMHVGMITINSEKMSKSLRNMIVLKSALKKWGSNVLRLYLISSQYSKPMDYNYEILQESLQKWRQIEHCIYELRTTKNVAENMDEFEDKCNGFLNDFLSSLDSNLNTPLALTSFMKLVSYVNNLSSSEKLTIRMSDKALPIVDTIMDIIGIKLMEIDNDTKFKIEEMIDRRDNLRAEKKFQAADNLRKKIFELFDVELTDHSKYTSWKKKERIEFECEQL
ncbi:MAG: cysteine--tRNA ligase [Nitrososphaeraceae archaeon]|nr:cysteine--tRNA ligase [Nitrososphaeraceae archaeon]MDW0151137.1 cysteine--tRNA ligase [Nitrososphaeraceae archaeon]MDW0153085.1 cysteine--tRNA ligase [Nitrososphaeraceae archaeon]MDW0166255.1 cysteine--tRNA ligase [Nitrososphaeraceae archaeon]MDW3653522.1 cysteine--tRNA ligase [Nitrososphaeraceae archaeon]